MAFIKHKLNSRRIAIIDIWSHKIKVWICEIIWDNSTIIWYWEKRQDSNYSFLWEYTNIEWICENIKEATLKAESNAGYNVNEIIINFPFEEVFFCFKKINYNRKNPDSIIDKEESDKILSKIKSININSCTKNISLKSSYLKDDLKLIINNISNIKIDWVLCNNILNKSWENIQISILDILIPISKYNLLHYIWNILNKKILKIIPLEFSIVKLFNDIKDIVIIDLWNSHTSIIVKKENDLIWVSKAPLWINDLINTISLNNNITKIEAINLIDNNIYLKEKEEFLNIFEDLLISGLEEIVWKEICPNKFFITGWWWNDFIKQYIKNANLNKKDLKIMQNINIVELEEDLNMPWNDKITTNILSLAKITPSLLNNL